MKSILFVISTLAGGGAERTVSMLSRHLSNEMKCSVLLNSQSESDYEFYGDIISLGMKSRVKKSVLYQMIAAYKRYFKLRELKKEGEYDAVISFMESANTLNILTGNERCKTIVSVRTILTERYVGFEKLVLFMVKALYKKADCIVPLSETARRDLIAVGVQGNNITTIYNGYDLSRVNYETKRRGSRFITMGRLVYSKGQWHLIRAFSKVVKKYPNASLKILGQGDFKDLLLELIEKYRLHDNVELVGFVNNPSDYLKESDCFVFSSIYEGFGNAIIEAMLNGLPIIASDCNAAREILAPDMNPSQIIDTTTSCKYGVLTPSSSHTIYKSTDDLDCAENELANAMVEFIENEHEYDHVNQMECLKRFSISRVITDWKKVICA